MPCLKVPPVPPPAERTVSLSQPDVSKLMNGLHTRFSVDRLIALLNALEMDVDIVVRAQAKSRGHRAGLVRVPADTGVR